MRTPSATPSARDHVPAAPSAIATPLPARYAYLCVLGLFAAPGASHTWDALVDLARMLGVHPPAWAGNAEPWIESVALYCAWTWLSLLIARQRREPKTNRPWTDLGSALIRLACLGLYEADRLGWFTADGTSTGVVGHLAQLVILVWLALAILSRSGIRLREVGIASRHSTPHDAASGPLLTLTALACFIAAGALNGLLHMLPGPQLHCSQDAANGLTTVWMVLSHTVWSAIVEELIVTGAVVALLAAARRPLWECLTVSALMRFIPHLYLGLPSLAMLAVGVVLAWLMIRYGRVLPLITAHLAFNLLLISMPLLLPVGWQAPTLYVAAAVSIAAAQELKKKGGRRPAFCDTRPRPATPDEREAS